MCRDNHRHVLQTQNGFTIMASLDNSLRMRLQWSPAMPSTRAQFNQLMPEYTAWRDSIYEAECQKRQVSCLMLTSDGNGGFIPTHYGKEFAKKKTISK